MNLLNVRSILLPATEQPRDSVLTSSSSPLQWLLIGVSEIYLSLSEDSDHRNDACINACLKISGMLSSLCSSSSASHYYNGLTGELDALTSSTIHVVRTACRQETMRYDRMRVPKGE